MAVQTIEKDLYPALHDAICLATGMPGHDVRAAYQEDGMPAQTRTEDICYVFLQEVDNDYSRQRDIVYTPGDGTADGTETTSYTRVFEASCTFEGPNSYKLADDLRYGILEPAARKLTNAVQMFPVASIPVPTRLPYNEGGQWWYRSDLRITYYVATVRVAGQPYLVAADIKLYTEKGLDRTLHVVKE